MVQKIEDLKWSEKNKALEAQDLRLLNRLPFKLPEKFIELLKISNGGTVNHHFEYYNIDMEFIDYTVISYIYGINQNHKKYVNENYDPFSNEPWCQEEHHIIYENIIDNYHNPPECFPKNIVAFAINGGGDRICFDYRKAPNSDNPPIVFWDHGADIETDISFIAKDFEEFISMLKEPEDIE